MEKADEENRLQCILDGVVVVVGVVDDGKRNFAIGRDLEEKLKKKYVEKQRGAPRTLRQTQPNEAKSNDGK